MQAQHNQIFNHNKEVTKVALILNHFKKDK